MLDRSAVGAVSDPVTRSWSSDDALLYALALGAGTADLSLVTENSEGITQRVFPTYAALLAGGSIGLRRCLGEWPPQATVHAAQRVSLPGPLPAHGDVEVVSQVAAITDKGSGALLEIEATGRRSIDGACAFTAVTSLFLRGQGWGEPEHAADPAQLPTREPDLEVEATTAASQALLYRLCGDRNPLHSDPRFAEKAGFERPILHGLCTWGIGARVLLEELERFGEADPVSRFASYGGRFRAPVLPGDRLTVRAWRTGRGTWVHTTSVGDHIVIDRGELSLHPEEP